VLRRSREEHGQTDAPSYILAERERVPLEQGYKQDSRQAREREARERKRQGSREAREGGRVSLLE
jgi:hypothetical protein